MVEEHVTERKASLMEAYKDVCSRIEKYVDNDIQRYEEMKAKFDFSKPLRSVKLLFSRAMLKLISKEVFHYEAYNYIYHESRNHISLFRMMNHIFFQTDEYLELYELFKDEKSKSILDWSIKFRLAFAIIGKNAMNVFPPILAMREELRCKKNSHILSKEGEYYKVKDYKIKCTSEIYEAWVSEMYKLAGKCEPREGDTVIDAGALYGETAIWFADIVGSGGKVYSFEPTAKSYETLQQNIAENNLNHIITAVNKGVWDENKMLHLRLNEKAGGNYCSDKSGDRAVEAITLDWFVENENIPSIDYIKMDVEGCELRALKGASRTIAKYKPRMAISVYHNIDDIIEIPLYIKSLVPEYSFYLSHRTYCYGEIVLFAVIE